MATPVSVPAAQGGAWTLQLKDSALQGRLHDGADLMQMSSTVPMSVWRDGVLAATGAEFQVSALGSPNQTVNVSAGAGLCTRTGQGPYKLYCNTTQNVPLDAANATNPRIDVVYARAVDNVGFSEGADTLQFGIVTGTPSGSPVVPALPSGAYLKLAEIAVPSLATRPSNQVQAGDITDKRRAAGHIDGIRTLLAGDALGDAGFRIGEMRDSTQISGVGFERWNGTGWDPVSFVNGWIAYTPTMSGMLNNAGTFTARYRRIGKAVWLNVKFVPAATANLGTGVPIVSLPFQATSAAAGLMAGTGRILDGSGNNRPLWPIANPGDTGLSIFGLNSSLVYVSPGSAGYSWGNSSELEVTFGPYECV